MAVCPASALRAVPRRQTFDNSGKKLRVELQGTQVLELKDQPGPTQQQSSPACLAPPTVRGEREGDGGGAVTSVIRFRLNGCYVRISTPPGERGDPTFIGLSTRNMEAEFQASLVYRATSRTGQGYTERSCLEPYAPQRKKK